MATLRRGYLSLAQFPCDGLDGDKASSLNFSNCRGQPLSSHVSGTLLILASLPHVIKPKRVSIRVTVVRCHLPPWAAGMSLRFNSSASADRERKPAARSSRMVEAKALARESAARLLANAPCIPRLRDEVSPRTIGSAWPGCAAATDVKFVSRSAREAGQGLWPPTRSLRRKSDDRSCGSLGGCPNKPGSERPHRPDRRQPPAPHRRCAERSGLLPGIGR